MTDYGGGGEVRKINSCKGRVREKIHAQRVAQKNVLAYGKNIPAREILAKKIFLRLENSPPPTHNVSNGPSLKGASISELSK